ncbi:MAG: hypothetical protein ACE5JP_00730 [Candidatus Bipolaricaulia bacterium]
MFNYTLRAGNRAVLKRFGYIAETLELFDTDVLETFRGDLSGGYSALDPGLAESDGERNARWRLIINFDVRATIPGGQGTE